MVTVPILGFTLLELVIVLTLLAILTAAVVPVFNGSLGTVSRDHAVRDLVAAIKYGQERAVTDLKEYRLYLVPESGQYYLMSLKSVKDGKKTFERLSERYGESFVLPERLKMAKPKATEDRAQKAYYVAFYPNGACDRSKITLTGEKSKKIEIETQGALGDVEVKK